MSGEAPRLFSLEEIQAALEGVDPGAKKEVLERLALTSEQSERESVDKELFDTTLAIGDWLYRKHHAMHSADGHYAFMHSSDFLKHLARHPDLTNPIYKAVSRAIVLSYVLSREWDTDESFRTDEIRDDLFKPADYTIENLLLDLQRGVDADGEVAGVVTPDSLQSEFGFGFTTPLIRREAFRPYTKIITHGLAELGIELPLPDPMDEGYDSPYDPDLCEDFPEFESVKENGRFIGRQIAAVVL